MNTYKNISVIPTESPTEVQGEDGRTQMYGTTKATDRWRHAYSCQRKQEKSYKINPDIYCYIKFFQYRFNSYSRIM